MNDEELSFLVCLPVIDNPDGNNLAASSIKNKCSECGREVWIAPSGRKLITEKGLIIICLPCAHRKEKEAGESGTVMPLTPEQQGEIRRALGKNKLFPDDETP